MDKKNKTLGTYTGEPTDTSSIKPTPKVITGCTFTGVHWDATAVTTIQTVANGLLENAKALHSLVSVFKAQNINIEAMVKITND